MFKVYVLDKNRRPLMPTSRCGKVKYLLRKGKARVVGRCPFTIQLLYEIKGYTQKIVLGVDAGSKTIGLSATTKKKELYAAEVELRSDVTNNLSTHKELRRARRSRKTKYRASKFNNRVKRKHKGWLAPTIEQKIHTHEKAIADVCKILPISKIIVETASFDIQKIRDSKINGIKYQQGEQLDFWNVREYIFWCDGYKCQHCHGKSKNKVLNVHHIESRKTGGDAPNNLVTMCETCHKALHKGAIKLCVKRGNSFRDAAFMGIMRWELYKRLKERYSDVRFTYGYITKNTRIKYALNKTHAVDARCISGNPDVEPLNIWFRRKAVRTRNRQIHKAIIGRSGTRKINQSPKHVFGFQLFDNVSCHGQEGFIFGRRKSGSFDIRRLNGIKISGNITYKKLKLLRMRQTILTEKEIVAQIKSNLKFNLILKNM